MDSELQLKDKVLFISLSYGVVSWMAALLSADWYINNFEGCVQQSQ